MSDAYFYNGGSGGSVGNSMLWFSDSFHLLNFGNVPSASDDIHLDDFVTGGSVEFNTLDVNGQNVSGATFTSANSQTIASGSISGSTFNCPVTFTGTSNEGGTNVFHDDCAFDGVAPNASSQYLDRIQLAPAGPWFYHPNSPGVAAASNVKAGTTNLGVSGTCAVPIAADVRYGTSTGSTTGTCRIPSAGDVQSGVQVDNTTGTFAVPAVSDVKNGVQYGAAGTEFTGTYIGGSGNVVFPTESQVLADVDFGPTGADYTGNVVLPAAGDVQEGVTFGASSALTGAFVSPSEADVSSGVEYGNDAEFVGTYGEATPWDGTIVRTVTVQEKLRSQSLNCYQFASYILRFVCEDSEENGIALTGKTIKFLLYDTKTQVVAHTIDGTVSSGNLVDVAFPDDYTTAAGSFGFVLRNQTDDVVLSYGTVTIVKVPDVPAEPEP